MQRTRTTWKSCVLKISHFLVYSYCIYPASSIFSKRSESKWRIVDGLLLLLLIQTSIFAIGSSYKWEVHDAPVVDRAMVRGTLEGFKRGGVGGVLSMILKTKEGEFRFNLVSIRDTDVIEDLKLHEGKALRIWYIQARGIFGTKSFQKLLPAHIESRSGEVLFDYAEHREWFMDPLNGKDVFVLYAFFSVLVLYIFYMPIRYHSKLNREDH